MQATTLPKAARLSSPNPVTLVCTRKPDGATNLATVSWWSYLSYNPEMVAFAMAKRSYSGERVRETGEVILALPGTELAQAVLGCGTTTGRDTNKAERFHIELTRLEGSAIQVPRCSRLAIICRLSSFHETGDHYLYICAVTRVYGDSEQEPLFAWKGYAQLQGAQPKNSFLQLAAARYSVRSFAERPIAPRILECILRAGQLAPTAVNYQPQKIYVLKSNEALHTIRALTRFTYGAPVVLLCCADISRAWQSPAEPAYNTGEMDVSIVCTHIMLEAWEQGIGSVWVRGFDPGQVARAFDLPEHIKPICLLPLGYPSEDAAPYADWHQQRRPLSETVEER